MMGADHRCPECGKRGTQGMFCKCDVPRELPRELPKPDRTGESFWRLGLVVRLVGAGIAGLCIMAICIAVSYALAGGLGVLLYLLFQYYFADRVE